LLNASPQAQSPERFSVEEHQIAGLEAGTRRLRWSVRRWKGKGGACVRTLNTALKK